MNNKNSKLEITIRQHQEIIKKEMSYSEDLQNKERISKHKEAIKKIKKLMEE